MCLESKGTKVAALVRVGTARRRRSEVQRESIWRTEERGGGLWPLEKSSIFGREEGFYEPRAHLNSWRRIGYLGLKLLVYLSN